jgi:hypothetical protein
MPSIVLAIVEERRRLPEGVGLGTLRGLDAWNVTETELRELAKKKGLLQ